MTLNLSFRISPAGVTDSLHVLGVRNSYANHERSYLIESTPPTQLPGTKDTASMPRPRLPIA